MAGRSSAPSAASRSAPWPTKWATLTDGRSARRASRYWANVSQRRSSAVPSPPAHTRVASRRAGATGAGENEHIPTTSVVTPWRTFDSADGQPK